MIQVDNTVDVEMNPGRILFGLSRIGYTPSSAICDIIDNSVTAKASNIYIKVQRVSDSFSDTKKNNVKDYIIIDDGKGMDADTILNSLALGATDINYDLNTLSKFGLGLKSATFSQGDRLVVISSKGESNFVKYEVDINKVQNESRYFATKDELNDEELALISKYLPNGKGTIVRIADVRKEGHPAIKQTIEVLKKKIGVIYYYFIKDDGLKIHLEDEIIPEFDVLFTEEASTNGNLDENEWSGRTVNWIQTPKQIVLDVDTNILGTIEVTQLPHPPTFNIDKRGGDKEVRDKYLIEAGNYGYYVYRNKRLISWAESFGTIIPYNQDLYSFRGRILIDDSADNAFNIDVKKSTLNLSEEAWNTISDFSIDFKKKSIKAWNRAKSLKKEFENEEPNQQSNNIISLIEQPVLPGQPSFDDESSTEIDRELERKMKEKVSNYTIDDNALDVSKLGGASSEDEEVDINQEFEIKLKGEVNPYATKIFRVNHTEDNVLWEPYYDAEHEYCVRINKLHRFSKLIFEDNSENADLQILMELFLHQSSVSEINLLKHLRKVYPEINSDKIENVLKEYRRYTSEYLAHMVRHLEGKLPPFSN